MTGVVLLGSTTRPCSPAATCRSLRSVIALYGHTPSGHPSPRRRRSRPAARSRRCRTGRVPNGPGGYGGPRWRSEAAAPACPAAPARRAILAGPRRAPTWRHRRGGAHAADRRREEAARRRVRTCHAGGDGPARPLRRGARGRTAHRDEQRLRCQRHGGAPGPAPEEGRPRRRRSRSGASTARTCWTSRPFRRTAAS